MWTKIKKLDKPSQILLAVIVTCLLGAVTTASASPVLDYFQGWSSHDLAPGTVNAFLLLGERICLVSQSTDGSDVEQECWDTCYAEPCRAGSRLVPEELVVATLVPTPPPIFPTKEPEKDVPTNTPRPTERPGFPTHTPLPTPQPTNTMPPYDPDPTATPPLIPVNTATPVPVATATIVSTRTATPVPEAPEPECHGQKVLICHNGTTQSVSCNSTILRDKHGKRGGPHGKDHGGVTCYMGPCQ